MRDGHVLMTSQHNKQLIEYADDGAEVCRVSLPGNMTLYHAAMTARGTYIVCWHTSRRTGSSPAAEDKHQVTTTTTTTTITAAAPTTMKWNEMKWKCSDLNSFENRLGAGLVNTPCKQIQPMSRVKSLDGLIVRVIGPVGKEKVYGRKDLPKSQVLSSEWNTERVREDASGDSEDGEDDELPCVIGERAGDCVW